MLSDIWFFAVPTMQLASINVHLPPQLEEQPDYSLLIVDHRPYIEKKCRRAAVKYFVW